MTSPAEKFPEVHTQTQLAIGMITAALAHDGEAMVRLAYEHQASPVTCLQVVCDFTANVLLPWTAALAAEIEGNPIDQGNIVEARALVPEWWQNFCAIFTAATEDDDA